MEEEQTIEKCDACIAEEKYGGRSYLHVCGKKNEKDN